MLLHIITLSVDYNYLLKRLDTQLYEPNNQNLLKSSKLSSQRIRKRYYKTLGDNCNKQPIVPSLSLPHHICLKIAESTVYDTHVFLGVPSIPHTYYIFNSTEQHFFTIAYTQK